MPENLELIDLDQPALTGYRRFISCWLSRGDGPVFIVDPGPAASAPHLRDRLRQLGVTRLDLILLTHIHLDHGGGAADLLDAYPGARVYCHPAGRQHLTAPGRLWEGSRQVLGEVAAVYGEPRPVPEATLAGEAELAEAGIAVIATPGHAPHHVSFQHAGTLFVGEAAGTFLDLGDGRWYLRPATPPRFRLEVAVASLDRLLALDPPPARLAFAHHGLLAGRAPELLARARQQLVQWVDTVRAALAAADVAAAAELAVARLAASDPDFARLSELPSDIRVREEDFTRQTLRGMVEYVQSSGGR
ncbi:MAG: MBL fold metallo-hydrolase [Candidatus Krumholzibacteria bacterium]|jgi:glyoxylase-like metal-dependent hydrolase (beta-lactamase superfamily II)|nr:MBL fold metallo-hydrolase [Candidatus Krumholzibacteria bacterium]